MALRICVAVAIVSLLGSLAFAVQLEICRSRPAPSASLLAPAAMPLHDDASAQIAQTEEFTDAGDDTVDVYGNEVSDAVATYKLDATGGLYEVHSPRTELPRLGSPSS